MRQPDAADPAHQTFCVYKPPRRGARPWTNFPLTGGGSAPYGLGWFVQNINGMKVIWHYGLWTANSSLIIKVPERGLTFSASCETAVAALTLELAQAGIGLQALVPRTATLEELFFRLTEGAPEPAPAPRPAPEEVVA